MLTPSPGGQRCALPTRARHRNHDPNCRRFWTQLSQVYSWLISALLQHDRNTTQSRHSAPVSTTIGRLADLTSARHDRPDVTQRGHWGRPVRRTLFAEQPGGESCSSSGRDSPAGALLFALLQVPQSNRQGCSIKVSEDPTQVRLADARRLISKARSSTSISCRCSAPPRWRSSPRCTSSRITPTRSRAGDGMARAGSRRRRCAMTGVERRVAAGTGSAPDRYQSG
jgi:hypothetical protein